MAFNLEKLDSIMKRFYELEREICDPAVIADNQKWIGLCRERANLEQVVRCYEEYKTVLDQLKQAEDLAHNSDPDLSELARAEIEELTPKREDIEHRLKILLLPQDPDDTKNAIVEIRAGAGGDEAALFGYELMRMYKMYADKNRWTVEDIDINLTELGGVKEAIFSVSGTDVFSKLRFESGVHRVQRVPETETQGRVHTSTVTVAVLPEAEDVSIEINEKDLKIDTYRSGGAGGQHVNKTESAIRITHIPTGIVVQCQDERSQIKNRDKAMKVLKSKLYEDMQSKADSQYAAQRKSQVGTGDRSERIRTYNYPQGRVSDHRINMTIYSLESFLNGDIEEMIEALRVADQTAKLEAE